MAKIWMFEYFGEGSPNLYKFFREENPPSIDRLKEILIEWGVDDNLDEKLSQLKAHNEWYGYYEFLTLGLFDVE